jgi:hypothetical protein
MKEALICYIVPKSQGVAKGITVQTLCVLIRHDI